MSTTAAAPLRTSSSTKRKVKHLYWWSDGQIAREMGVEVRGLCGFWFALRKGVAPIKVSADDLAPRHCKRCVSVYRAAKRRGWAYVR